MSHFHFIRVELLLFLIPAWILVWWLLKQQNDEKTWQPFIDVKLLKHLLLQSEHKGSKLAAPWHLGAVLTLLILAVSGPSWKHKETPFAKDDTKIAFLLCTNKSMLTTDVLPNRLKRATIKIDDLLQKRADTASALIAYSGSAHLVLPLTSDHDIINTFAQSLDPSIMPLEGDVLNEALLLAQKTLNTKGATIIVLTDSVSASLLKLAQKNGFNASNPVVFWQIGSQTLINQEQFENASALLDAPVIKHTKDDSDVLQVSSLIDNNFKNASSDDKDSYEDGGYVLVPLLFLLLLLWVRQGFIAELWRRG